MWELSIQGHDANQIDVTSSEELIIYEINKLEILVNLFQDEFDKINDNNSLDTISDETNETYKIDGAKHNIHNILKDLEIETEQTDFLIKNSHLVIIFLEKI